MVNLNFGYILTDVTNNRYKACKDSIVCMQVVKHTFTNLCSCEGPTLDKRRVQLLLVTFDYFYRDQVFLEQLGHYLKLSPALE
jgi:hypothetical protein